MSYFPMFTDIKNKKCLIVGGGKVACRKKNTLIKYGADITVVAKEIKFDFSDCRTIEKEFEEKDIENYFIVIAATDNRAVNNLISKICHTKGINVNVADSSEESSFIFGATVLTGNMTIAVNSGENNPSKSKGIKNDIMKFLNTIKIGTRKSPLAKIQTDIVADLIRKADENINIEIVEISTLGDKDINKSLSEFGGKGAFTNKLENAIIDGRIDIAVHSGKDLPVEISDKLEILATPKRADANDVLVKLKNKVLDDNSIIGTGSLRRAMQIDYKTKDIRGNVDTRLRKMENGEYDGVVLALAGLKRLGLDSADKYDYKIYDTNKFYPAPCQGIIAVEGLKNSRFSDLIKSINDENTFYCFKAERKLLKELGLGCQMPFGAYSYIEDNDIVLNAVYLSDNKKYFEHRTKKENAEFAAEKIADKIRREL